MSDECFIGVCDAQWCLCTYEHQTLQTQTQILDLTEEMFTDDAKSPSDHHIHHIQKVFIFVFWSVASPGGPVCYCRLTFRYLHTQKKTLNKCIIYLFFPHSICTVDINYEL